MSNFAKRIREWHKHKELIKEGILIPVKSYEEYVALVKEAKQKASNKVFSNCYMLPAEIKRLISLKSFYQVNTETGLVFVDDEGPYYHMVFFVDIKSKLVLPTLEKDILIENVYYEGRKTQLQDDFEKFLESVGCVFLNTYRGLEEKPSLAPDKFFKKLSVLENTLAIEGKKIAVPKYEQLPEFEKVYRSIIDKYVQKKFTLKERKKQADAGLLYCITDNSGKIYAIAVRASVQGGAYGSRKEYQNNIYAPVLLFYLFKNFYDNIPKDLDEQKRYMRSRSISGWIAVDNKASWRIHKMLGIKATGKSMNQFVIKAK